LAELRPCSRHALQRAPQAHGPAALLAGSLPPRALRLVKEWALAHEDELLANWERVRNLEPLVAIEPLA